MKILVKRRHINEGLPRKLRECPIALAFEEATGERPEVDGFIINTYSDSFALPRSAKRFIARFDAGKPVKPFKFTISYEPR